RGVGGGDEFRSIDKRSERSVKRQERGSLDGAGDQQYDRKTKAKCRCEQVLAIYGDHSAENLNACESEVQFDWRPAVDRRLRDSKDESNSEQGGKHLLENVHPGSRCRKETRLVYNSLH